MNNAYRIKVAAPLLRPGLEIETTVSRRYAKEAVKEIMDVVREINGSCAEVAAHEEGEE